MGRSGWVRGWKLVGVCAMRGLEGHLQVAMIRWLIWMVCVVRRLVRVKVVHVHSPSDSRLGQVVYMQEQLRISVGKSELRKGTDT